MSKALPKRLGNLFIDKLATKHQRRSTHKPKPQAPLEVNLVTSWDRQCGIATYSAYLTQELRKTVKVYVTGLPKKNGLSPYFLAAGYTAGRSHDLVHVQFEYGIFPSLKLGKRTLTAFSALLFYFGLALGNRQVITTIHEPRKTVSASGRSGLLYTRLLDRLIFSVSNLIIVHTQESKRLMEQVYGVELSKLRVIPHGSYQQPQFLDKEAAKASLGLKGKTVVTILGFVTPKKGHDLALSILPKLNPNIQLLIAGGPQNTQDALYLSSLKELTEKLHCSERVTFTGFLPDLTMVLNASDVAVLPYRYVTDSGVLHLLVAYGVPTVASDLAAFKEVYDEYSCLDLFKTGDTEDLYAKLQALLSSPEHQAALKAKCAVMWNATKWSTIAQKHVELYRQIV